jgi:hypothetical protein
MALTFRCPVSEPTELPAFSSHSPRPSFSLRLRSLLEVSRQQRISQSERPQKSNKDLCQCLSSPSPPLCSSLSTFTFPAFLPLALDCRHLGRERALIRDIARVRVEIIRRAISSPPVFGSRERGATERSPIIRQRDRSMRTTGTVWEGTGGRGDDGKRGLHRSVVSPQGAYHGMPCEERERMRDSERCMLLPPKDCIKLDDDETT